MAGGRMPLGPAINFLSRTRVRFPFCSPTLSNSNGLAPAHQVRWRRLHILPVMILPTDNSYWLGKVCEKLLIPIVPVKLATGRTLIYAEDDLQKFPLPINFEAPLTERDALASPLAQVFSMSMETCFDSEGESPSEIYGTVQVNQGRHTSSLYARGLSDCETISRHGDLSLIGPENAAISPSLQTPNILDVCLKDKARNVEVVRGQLDLLPKFTANVEDSFDKLMEVVVRGQHGWVTLHYITFRYAVFATVTVAIFESQLESIPYTGNYSYYGSIAATYPNGKKYCRSDNEIQHLKTVLFNKSSDQSVGVRAGMPFELSRSVVAVPAYSSLIIEADISYTDGQPAPDTALSLLSARRYNAEFAKGSVEFTALDGGHHSMLIDGNRGRILINVTWNNAYQGCTQLAEGSQEEFTKEKSDGQIPAQVHDDDDDDILLPLVYSPWGPRHVCSDSSKDWGSVLVEVFSVFVGGITQEVADVSGDILAQHRTSIYNGSWRDPESLFLGNNSTVPLIRNRAIDGSSGFCLQLSLMDPVKDLDVSRGELLWDLESLDEPTMSCYNKRLCSVVRGLHGYAAVHYTLFDKAVTATVEVTCSLNNPAVVPTNIYGCVFAGYGSLDYPSSYEKKFFRSRLFDRPEPKSLEVTKCSEIPLLKSVVAVPISSSLIIEADLKSLVGGELSDEVCDSAEFELLEMPYKCCKVIQGEHYTIQVTVTVGAS